MENNNNRIIVYGTRWCPDCVRTKLFLDKRKVAYEYIDIDQDMNGRKFVMETNQGFCSVPTILFPDGSTLTEPSSHVLEIIISTFRI